MNSLKWEGIGTKNLFPHTSSWQCRQHAVAVVQSGHYERQDRPADPTTNLAQTTNVVEASSSDLSDVFFVVSSESV